MENKFRIGLEGLRPGKPKSGAFGLFELAYSRGYSDFDTARVYGLGYSESSLAQWFDYAKPLNATVSTKIGLRWENVGGARARVFPAVSRDEILTDFEKAVRKFSRGYIQQLFLHRCFDVESSLRAFDCMAELRERFEVFDLELGVSNFSKKFLDKLVTNFGTDFRVQVEMNPFCDNRNILSELAKIGVAVDFFSPFDRGLLGNSLASPKLFVGLDEALTDGVTQVHGLLSEYSLGEWKVDYLSWLLSQLPARGQILVGASSRAHFDVLDVVSNRRLRESSGDFFSSLFDRYGTLSGREIR